MPGSVLSLSILTASLKLSLLFPSFYKGGNRQGLNHLQLSQNPGSLLNDLCFCRKRKLIEVMFVLKFFYLSEDEVGSRISLNAQESCLNFAKKYLQIFSETGLLLMLT